MKHTIIKTQNCGCEAYPFCEHASNAVKETKPPVSRAQQIKIIREAYDSIPDLQDGFKDVREYLFDLNETAERRHRKGAPYGIKHGLTVNDAAKLFTVSHLMDGFAQPDKWSVDHITSIRTEVLIAQSYAKRFHAELTEWAAKYSAQFEQVDYAELMKVGRV